MRDRDDTNTERARLASWALLQLAGGTARVSWDDKERALVIQETEDPAEGDPELMEMSLGFMLIPVDASDLLERLRESPNTDVVFQLFSEIIGPEKAKEVARSLEGSSHDDIIREAYRRTLGIYDLADNNLVRSRERIVTDFHPDYEGHNLFNREANISRAVFSEYAREFALTLPGIIRRAEKLRLLHAAAEPPDRVQKYIAEATKCYLFGRYLAAALVCRAAVEVSLLTILDREGRNREIKQAETQGRNGLDVWIQMARGLGNPELRKTLDQADHIRRVANGAAHGDPPRDAECKDLIFETRGVLTELFS